MKKINILMALLFAIVTGAQAGSFEPYSQWMLFTGEYAYTNNSVNKKMGFGGSSQVVATVVIADGIRIFAVADKGLYAYDGKQMTQISIPKECYAASSNITTMVSDGKGGLWLGTFLGLVHYEVGNFTNVPFESTKLQAITDITITASGKVYVSGLVSGEKSYVGGGVSFFNGTGWTNYNKTNSDIPDNIMTNLTVDPDGFLWGIPNLRQDTGVAKFDGKVWKLINVAAGLPVNEVRAITIDPSGKLWLGTTKGLVQYNGANWISKPFTNSFSSRLSDHLGGNSMLDVSALAFEKNGTIWVGTRNSGLFCFALDGMNKLTRENSPLTSSAIYSIEIDAKGWKWITSGNRNAYYGLSIYQERKHPERVSMVEGASGVTAYMENGMITDPKWTVYDSTRSTLWFGSIRALDEDKQGNVWMTMGGAGLVKFKGGKFTSYKHEKAMHSAFGDMYLAPDNKIYLAASIGGVKVFENDKISDFAKSPCMGGVTGMTFDKDNTLWASTQGGIYHWVKDDWESFKKGDGLPSIIIYNIFKDSKGTLWAGTAKGLVKYDTAWHEVGENVDFPSNDFTAIAEANGKLYLGTNKGISIYDGTTFTNIPKIELLGLNKFRVNAICVDMKGVVWVATEAYGVLRFDGTNWTQICKSNTHAIHDKVTAIKATADGKLYIAAEQSEMTEFNPQIPSSNPEEQIRQDIARRVKMAEPKRVLAVIQN